MCTDINFVSRFDRWFLRQADRNFFFTALDSFKGTYAATGRVLGYHIISILHTNVIVIKSPIATKALFLRVFRGLNMRACYICTDSTVHDLAFVVFEDSCMAAAALFRFDALDGTARFANVWCHASLNDDSPFRYEHYRLAVISFDNWQRRMHERYPKCRYLDTVCERSRIQLSARQLFDSRDGHFHGRELYSGSREGHIGFGSIHHLRCDAREHWPAHNLPLLNKDDYAAGSIQYCRAEMAELYYDGATDPGSTTPTLSDFEMDTESDSECAPQSIQQPLPAAAAALPLVPPLAAAAAAAAIPLVPPLAAAAHAAAIPLVPPPAAAAHAAAHAILVAGAIAPVVMVVPPAPSLVGIEPNPGPNHASRLAAARKLPHANRSPPEQPPDPDPEWPLPDPEHHPFPMPLPDVASSAISACIFPLPSVFPAFFPPVKPLVGVEKNPGPQCTRCGRSTHSTNSCSEQTTSAGNHLLASTAHRHHRVQRQSKLGDFFTHHRPRRDHDSASQPPTQRQSTLTDFFPNRHSPCDLHSTSQPKITTLLPQRQGSRRNCSTPDGEMLFESWRQHKKRMAAAASQLQTSPTAPSRITAAPSHSDRHNRHHDAPNLSLDPPQSSVHGTRNAAAPVSHTAERDSPDHSDPEHIRLAREECSRLRRLRFADSLEQLRREQSLAAQRALLYEGIVEQKPRKVCTNLAGLLVNVPCKGCT